MSYESADWIKLSEKEGVFSGGYVDNVQNVDMAPYFSPYIRNARLDGQSITIRPGHSLFSELTSGSYPKGIGSYLRTVSANDRLVVRHDQAYTPAFLTGGTGATSDYTTWEPITKGSFKITIDGVEYDMLTFVGLGYVGIDFTGVTDMDGVAAAIQARLRVITGGLETVVWSTDHFIVTSTNTTSISEVSVTSQSFENASDYLAFGVTDISGALAGTGAIAGMDANAGNGTPTGPGAVTSGLVTIDEDGAVTNISTGSDIASSNRMSFQNIGDVIYCMNGSDDFGKLSGTTYTTPSTGVSNFAPAFSVVFNGSHWAAGRPTNPNKVYKSVANDYEDFNSTGSDIFTFNETITGLSASTQALFYFTPNTISVTGPNDIIDVGGTVSYTNRKLQTVEGAVNNSCIVESGTEVYYLSTSNSLNKIVQGANVYGYEVVELSDRKYSGISKIMGSLDKDQSSAFGYLLPQEMLIKWFFRSSGSTFNDICIIYDITKDKFLVDNDKYFFDGVFFKGYNYTISTLEPKVYLDEYGQDDEDQPIPFEYRTKEFYISDATMKKLLWESRTLLDINELAECVQEIRVNGASVDTKTVDIDNYSAAFAEEGGGIGTQTVGSYAIGTDGAEEIDDYIEIILMRTKGNLNVKGRKIQRRFVNSSLAGKVRLKDLTAKIEILPALATRLTP